MEDFLYGDTSYDCVACCVVLCADGEDSRQLTVILGEGEIPENIPIPSIHVVCSLAPPQPAPTDDIPPLAQYGMCLGNIAENIRPLLAAGMQPDMRVILSSLGPNDTSLSPPISTANTTAVRLRPVNPDDWSDGALVSKEAMEPTILELLATPASNLSNKSATTTTKSGVYRRPRVCYYAPFCSKTAKECGGYAVGTCKRVNDGSVVIPTDPEEFQQAKKKATTERKANAKAKSTAKQSPGTPVTPMLNLTRKKDSDNADSDSMEAESEDKKKKKSATPSSAAAATTKSVKKPQSNVKSRRSTNGKSPDPREEEEVKRTPNGDSTNSASVKKGSGTGGGKKDGAKIKHETVNSVQKSEVVKTEEVATEKASGDDNLKEPATAVSPLTDDKKNGVSRESSSKKRKSDDTEAGSIETRHSSAKKKKKKKRSKKKDRQVD